MVPLPVSALPLVAFHSSTQTVPLPELDVNPHVSSSSAQTPPPAAPVAGPSRTYTTDAPGCDERKAPAPAAKPSVPGREELTGERDAIAPNSWMSVTQLPVPIAMGVV